jgi:peptide/nickel transport system permease protein
MQRYLLTRIITGFITLFVVSFIVFGLINLVPGDVVAVLMGDQGYTEEEAFKIREQLGMNRPLPVRYASWLGDIARLDLGESIKSGRKVTDIIETSLPVTAELALISIVLTVAIGIPLGVWSAVRQDRPDDYIMRLLAIAGLSIPSFWIGTMVVVLPAIWWGWVPPLFYKTFAQDPWGNVSIMLIPAAILGAHSGAVLMRITRSSVLEVLREDYVRTARAKGLASLVVLRRHVLRNSVLPVLTVLGGQLAFLLSGAIVVETIFNLPGLGTVVVRALTNRDFPVITGVTLLISFTVVVVNLIVDLLYRVFDPRITY